MPDADRWALRPLVRLSWHEWPEGAVAFDETSGQIVEFDPLGAAVMACIEESPSSIPAMADELARDLGHSADAEFTAAVRHVVQQFQVLGWVEPIIDR